MKRKKYNKYPFILLFVIHISLLLFTFIRKREKKQLFVLLLTNMGFAYLFEYVILNIFQSYKYKPKIIKSRYLDNIFGAILSQAVYIPFTSIFITGFNLGWKVKAFFVIYFNLIERLFIKLKVYQTNWWRPYFTTMLLPIYFTLSDKWYEHLKKGTPFVLLISHFFSIMVTGVNIIYFVALTGYFRFGRGLFHTWKEHFIIAPLYTITLSIFTTWSLQRTGWLGQARTLLFAICLDWLLYRSGTVKIKIRIPYLNVLIHILMIFLSNQYNKLIYRNMNEKKETVLIKKSR